MISFDIIKLGKLLYDLFQSSNKKKIYISFTTIPSRINGIKPILNSFINQTVPVEKIFLCIPKYSIREQVSYEIPSFMYDEPYKTKVEIIHCDDFGPATKLLGSINNVRNSDLIIILDDDRITNPNTVELLLKGHNTHPSDIIYLHGTYQKLPEIIPWG